MAHLVLEFARLANIDDPFAFAFKPQRYLLRGPGAIFDEIDIDWDTSFIDSLRRLACPGSPPELVQALAIRLRALVATTRVWRACEDALEVALTRAEPVTLTIRSAAAELYALPWEFLALASGQRLGCHPGILLRYAWPQVAVPPRVQVEPPRALLAWSAAGGAIPTREHLRPIVSCFGGCTETLEHASLTSIRDALSTAANAGWPFTLLHVLCHSMHQGETVCLALDNRNHEGVDVVDPARIANVLGDHAHSLRTLVLMTCASGTRVDNSFGGLSQTLHRAGHEFVIGSRFPLEAIASVRFAEEFYDARPFSPSSVESAFIAGRSALQTERGDPSWASMQLYSASETASERNATLPRVSVERMQGITFTATGPITITAR
ncbi:MAG: CHAT domain-containing protein, partial [Myxococcales bacterium]|nr:CHAT domain-containing protein [Myxococcales bacterium]